MYIHKKLILLILVLALGLIAARPAVKMKRLTVVNKSGMAVEISLTGKELEQAYYLRIAEGTRLSPAEQSFTILSDNYTSSIYYVELWDPVYGSQCGTKGQTLDVTHNVEIIVLPCDQTPPNGGEAPSQIKYGGRNARNKPR